MLENIGSHIIYASIDYKNIIDFNNNFIESIKKIKNNKHFIICSYLDKDISNKYDFYRIDCWVDYFISNKILQSSKHFIFDETKTNYENTENKDSSDKHTYNIIGIITDNNKISNNSVLHILNYNSNINNTKYDLLLFNSNTLNKSNIIEYKSLAWKNSYK